MESNGSATILRWGLAFVFFYAAIAALLNPSAWIPFIPGFIGTIMSVRLFLAIFSIYQLTLAVLLFTGKELWLASLLATITFVGIVVANYQVIDITFRDIGLAFASLALFQTTRHNT